MKAGVSWKPRDLMRFAIATDGVDRSRNNGRSPAAVNQTLLETPPDDPINCRWYGRRQQLGP